MISFTSTLTAAAAVFSITSAYDIPDNLQRIYDAHKSGTCTNKLLGGFAPGVDSSDSSFAYCADISANTIYLHSDANGGQYADMDVDCDGANLGAGDCANDPTGQSQTAFQWIVADKYGIDDLDANVHSYVVFGNDDPAFDPQQHGMEPLSVMAVVCGGQLHYGVWGDTNGANTVGETSLALAQLCFPDEGLNGDNGHGDYDVLYIGFTGTGTVPDDAKWSTSSREEFEDSIRGLGDSLVADLSA
ncbi:uncharacterized protein LTHEOB_7439 [Lasiodiplodia theobromae]|uniref:uncharacterized protein n=1 Tax=Lasiodiplodia theobromae TaxID=45133 RepID=UPI0015C3F027|nr:uncharacterized protein LTHEOB_7439 [Lasiodiplodia theobromae]KAF4542709.1 hypothetical protein LTHEOB_7439 [Lasiodiplodia theobromae]